MHLFSQLMTSIPWTEEAQKNLVELMNEGIITSLMRASQCKKVTDLRVQEILKFNNTIINKQINKLLNERKQSAISISNIDSIC